MTLVHYGENGHARNPIQGGMQAHGEGGYSYNDPYFPRYGYEDYDDGYYPEEGYGEDDWTSLHNHWEESWLDLDFILEDDQEADWSEYKAINGPEPLPAATNPSPLAELNLRLNDLDWLTSDDTRRSSRRKFTRQGRRYRPVQDHGTAAGRRGVTENRRRAAARDGDPDPTIARQRKARFRERMAAA